MEQEKKRLDQPQFLPLSIAICDIDGLRMINSAYSHAEGDRLITEMAKLIQGCLGQDHVLGHAGGGEFILLMPNTDSQTAQQLTIDIKNRTESYHRTNKSAFYAASLSIGLSTKEKEDNLSKMFLRLPRNTSETISYSTKTALILLLFFYYGHIIC